MIADGLRVLFCGINPSLMSAATGHHFARPGNRFWPVLHGSGFTPRRLDPSEQEELLSYGLGITNVAARASARADELSRAELVAGGALLTERVLRHRPRWLAVVGVTAYRVAFADPRAAIGPQERTVGDTRIWALPNPSGLNAGWTTAAMVEEFGRLRAEAGD
ncbi:G/U mismatch-specific DNA glycosylase [Streptomyces sp. NPDC046977]|uniref:G/U mismatch-specific DNA glycosylase n=1 Tax=Streptomyces sp. NPDC046977 TaxID=3154703 RepID=UPI0033F33916